MNVVNNTGDNSIYDFKCAENYSKWKGVLIAALRKVSSINNHFFFLRKHSVFSFFP